MLLGLLGLVVYPILPDRFVDKWELYSKPETGVDYSHCYCGDRFC